MTYKFLTDVMYNYSSLQILQENGARYNNKVLNENLP